MESQNDQEEKVEKPFIVFHAYAGEMWFWRIAIPVALVCSLLALLK